jgi:hypothetical protein
MSVTEILDSAKAMESKKFEKLFRELSAIRMQKNAVPAISHTEASLIKKIDVEFDPKKWDRLKYLDWKSEESSLTSQEQSESLRLAEEYEQYSVDRLKNISQLALMRQVPIGDLIVQLGHKS